MFNGFLLAIILALPIIVSILVVAIFLGKGEWSGRRLISVFEFDTSKGLISQGLLWLSITTPIFIALSLGARIWPDYEVLISSEGFKNFIEISILPLAVMSISLPLTGLISRFHSTQQTAKQIEVVSFKNNLDAFYAHRKELMSYFSAMEPITYLGVVEFKYIIHPVLHVRFFEGVPEKGWPVAKRESFDNVERGILQGAKHLVGVLSPNEDSGLGDLDCYLQGCKAIYLAAQALHIREITQGLVSKGVMIKSNSCPDHGWDLFTIGTTTAEILAAVRYVKNYYDNLCDFAGVPRMIVSDGYEVVFRGGQRLLAGDLTIENLHMFDIQQMVEDGRAQYDEKHPSVRKAEAA
ncbi:hypothetical protein J2W17_003198 [Pseudomonas lini]|uniref:hypothetical protein n=1 Tax=Pseudomonas lini TaxID=163011 RepID=UPI0027882493|nr:hypothetical protein [Pseudomonas lini]MDQ0124250.1 hypothetical protein [Pseudomonas lini]